MIGRGSFFMEADHLVKRSEHQPTFSPRSYDRQASHTTGAATRPGHRLARAIVGLFIVIGIVSVAVRATFRTDAARRLDPVRSALLSQLGIADPRAAERPAVLATFDAPYAAHPLATALHLAAGAVLIVLLPVQLSTTLRTRRPALHRGSGRVAIGAGLLVTASALYFGLRVPFAGLPEAVITALVAGWFLLAVGRALVAIRRRDAKRHREWMLRAMAVPIGVAVIRLVGLVVDVALSGVGLSPAVVFALSLWIGWGLAIAGAEIWIRKTRDQPSTEIRAVHRAINVA